MRTSLIISTYNWSKALKICLLSVLNQKTLPTEIIIADDGSTSETKKIIDKIKLQTNTPIHHIWHKDEGFQLAKIRNKAIKKAKYEYIIQIDGDLILHPYFIFDHIKSARKNHFVRGSRVRLTHSLSNKIFKTEKFDFFSIFNKNIKNKFNGVRSSFLKRLTTKADKSPHNMLGCNMAYWKLDAKIINGYENKLIGWGHEDEEFAARLINLGLTKLKIKNTAIVYHLYHKERKRDNEGSHIKTINSVIQYNKKKAKNGINELT